MTHWTDAIAKRAVATLATGRRPMDGVPGWELFGIGRRPRSATRDDLPDDGDDGMRERSAAAARIARAVSVDPTANLRKLIEMRPTDGIVEIAKAELVESLLTRLRVSRHFANSRTRTHPLLAATVARCGLDVAGAFTLAHANGGKTEITTSTGHVSLELRIAKPGSKVAIIEGGAPLGPGMRLSVRDRPLIVLDVLPATLAAGLAGRRLREVVSHPLLDPLDATIEAVVGVDQITGKDDARWAIYTDIDPAPVEFRNQRPLYGQRAPK